MPLQPDVISQAVVGGLVVAGGVFNYFRGKVRDPSHATSQKSLREEMTAGFARVDRRMDQLEAHIVGPDGQNGLRGAVREIKDRLDGLEDRELKRLETRDVGTYDRRGM